MSYVCVLIACQTIIILAVIISIDSQRSHHGCLGYQQTRADNAFMESLPRNLKLALSYGCRVDEISGGPLAIMSTTTDKGA